MPARLRLSVADAVLGALSVLLLALAGLSLQWRMVHDAPLMTYIAYAIGHLYRVPYRDLFDMNMPGTYLCYLALGRATGFSDLGFRVADLGYLVLIGANTWLLLGRFGYRVAWVGVLLFSFTYLCAGSWWSLQREYLLLLPLGAAVTVWARPGERSPLRYGVIGALFGLAATIKPQSALGVLVLLGFAWRNVSPGRPAMRAWAGKAAACALGVALPLAAAFAWVAHLGGLPAFLDIARHYWPLYGQVSGQQQVLVGSARLHYLLTTWLQVPWDGIRHLWLLPLAGGLWAALALSPQPPEHRRLVKLLGALAACYAVVPVLSGQFWWYHLLPFLYFQALVCALCLVPAGPQVRQARRVAPVLALLVFPLQLGVPSEVASQLRTGRPTQLPSLARADEMAGYLQTHLQPGDTVQPLDWTGGAVHALLLARAPLATSFLYDFHFYHHVSNPYIVSLQERFLRELGQARPRFVVAVWDRPWIVGPDTADRFPALEHEITAHYRPAARGQGYEIFERISR